MLPMCSLTAKHVKFTCSYDFGTCSHEFHNDHETSYHSTTYHMGNLLV